MKPVQRKPLVTGVDGGDDDAPLGLVFPEALEGDVGDVEGTALPVGACGQAASGEQEQGRKSGGEKETAHSSKVQSGADEAPLPRARLWWCNADFDLTLAHGGGKMPVRILEAAGAMTWPLWPALDPDDFLIVPEPPPAGYRAYLEGMGLRVPHFVTEDGIPPEDVAPLRRARFTPFGWNAAAAARNARMNRPAAHPPLEVVRRVNSRAFSRELEETLCGDAACRATFCPTGKSVDLWLQTAPAGRYVAKGNHGLAGIGQLRFELPGHARDGSGAQPAHASLSASLRTLAARQGGLVVEEELAVVREWGVLFRLGRDGRRSPLRRHRLLSGPMGGYAGALVLSDNASREEGLWNRHRDEALRAVDAVAHALHEAGYFGPVGIDMFVFRRDGALHLRPLVDLNARQSMAWPAHGLAARFPGKALLFRQLATASLPRFNDYRALLTQCDNLSFDDVAQRGAILLTPLLPLSRASWAIIGRDEADVYVLQDAWLEAFRAPTRNTTTPEKEGSR